ncbi:hypothetical protein pb186bvf_004698 [Paramecium bursaria]
MFIYFILFYGKVKLFNYLQTTKQNNQSYSQTQNSFLIFIIMMLEEQENNQEFIAKSNQTIFQNRQQEILKQIPHLMQILKKSHKRVYKGSDWTSFLQTLFESKDQQLKLLAYLTSFELIKDIMSYYPQNSQEILNQARKLWFLFVNIILSQNIYKYLIFMIESFPIPSGLKQSSNSSFKLYRRPMQEKIESSTSQQESEQKIEEIIQKKRKISKRRKEKHQPYKSETKNIPKNFGVLLKKYLNSQANQQLDNYAIKTFVKNGDQKKNFSRQDFTKLFFDEDASKLARDYFSSFKIIHDLMISEKIQDVKNHLKYISKFYKSTYNGQELAELKL